MEESSSLGSMFKLNGSNYSIWKPSMLDLLYCKDLYLPLHGDTAKPEDMKDDEWKILHRKTVGYIRRFLEHSIFHHFANEEKADVLWKKLEAMFERKNALNKASIIRKIVRLRYKEGANMTEHLNAYQGLINQSINMKIPLDDEVIALLLLSSLPDSWDTLVVSLSNSAPNGELTLQTVKDCLLNEESRRKEHETNSEPKVLVAENNDKRGRSNSRGPQNKRDKSRGKSKARKDFKCHYCGGLNHYERDCRKKKRDLRNGNNENRNNDKDTTAVAVDGDVVIICDEACVSTSCQQTDWIVDSGASYHITPYKDMFTSYTSGNFGKVRMANHGVTDIVGIGDITLNTDTGCRLLLKNVRHIPDIRLNIISTGKLDDDGYANYFGEGKWKLTKGSLIVAKGRKQNSLYLMQARLSDGEVNVAVKNSSIELWHKRLGHLSQKGLQLLAKKKILPEVTGMPLQTCVDCLAGKQHRVAFQSFSPSRKTHPLDLVHTDLCYMKDRTLGGALYFVTFIDDFSRKVWCFALKSKDQVFEVFKHFQAKVERETGRKLKCIRADNGGEYQGPFEQHCNDHGIKLEKSVPKTPQHNGVAERMNRTICERIKCMLSHSKLPKSFWGEAMRTAVDLINLSPSAPLGGDIPERVWTGKDVSYKHLRVFGCRAYVHIPKDERSKLDDKTKPCIFLGYGHEEFGYRLWDPVNRKVIRSRDVVFCEEQAGNDTKQNEETKSSPDTAADIDPAPSPRTQHHGGVRQNDTTNEEPVDAEMPPMQGDDVPSVPPVRRSSREKQPSTRYNPHEYVMLTDGGEPESFTEAMSRDQKEKWLQAMRDEMKSLQENHTYDLVKLPKGRRMLRNKWVYKLKTEEHNPQPRYKARLVVKGFSQKKGVDFEEIFSPVVKMSSIRVVLGIAASLNLEIEQLDVKTAFLHGDLDEEIYMEQPEGFQVKGKENLVCRLRKSLYGLKQAPRQWYKKFDSFMLNNGYNRTSSDHCVFFKKFSDGDFIILLLYVDDMLIVGHDASKIDKLKKELGKSFAMKDLGAAKQILGMKISRNRTTKSLWLSQEQYTEKVLERFNMSKSKSVSTPLAGHFKLSSAQCPTSEKDKEEMRKIPYASAVGSLMYAMVCTRPDIAHAVGVVSRFLSNPGKDHWAAVKWIFRYLRGTSKVCLRFGEGQPVLDGYTDADMAGDIDSRKSTSGYLMQFAGGAVSWQSKLQKCVALSTTEAEYIAATEACKEMLWLKKFLQELDLKQDKYTLYCDSQSAIHLSKNSTFHSRSKHIDVRYHWIRDVLEEKLMQLDKVHTDENIADMLTKSLARDKLEACRNKAGLGEFPT